MNVSQNVRFNEKDIDIDEKRIIERISPLIHNPSQMNILNLKFNHI